MSCSTRICMSCVSQCRRDSLFAQHDRSGGQSHVSYAGQAGLLPDTSRLLDDRNTLNDQSLEDMFGTYDPDDASMADAEEPDVSPSLTEVDYAPNPPIPRDVQGLMDLAGSMTSKVDKYMHSKLNPVGLFTVLYFVDGNRSIDVVEGDDLTTFSCTMGCKNLRRTDGSFKMLAQQGPQGVYDHCTSQSHCKRVMHDYSGLEPKEWYNAVVACRLARSAVTKWKEKLLRTGARRVKPRVSLPDFTEPGDESLAFWNDQQSVASIFLNGLTASGATDPLTLPAESPIIQGARLSKGRTH
jgi:hypothetical protein